MAAWARALVLATMRRVSLAQGRIRSSFRHRAAGDGADRPPFWTVVGAQHVSRGRADQRGRWIPRILGKAGLAEVGAAKRWCFWSVAPLSPCGGLGARGCLAVGDVPTGCLWRGEPKGWWWRCGLESGATDLFFLNVTHDSRFNGRTVELGDEFRGCC